MSITLHFTQSPDDKEAIYRLRYETYVQEMQLFGNLADHVHRRLVHELDATSRVIVARSGGEAVGSARLHLGKDGALDGTIGEVFDLARFEGCIDPEDMIAVTFLTVRKDFRESDLPLELMRETARVAREEGAYVVFYACPPHLLNLYFGLGFRSYGSRVLNHPEFGLQVPLVLLPGDLSHLAEVRSPLEGVAAGRKWDEEKVARVLEAVGLGPVRSIDASDSDGWKVVYSRLGEIKRPGPRFFDHLCEDEIKSVVAHGHVLACQPGDRLIRKGQPARNVMVVLSGSLEVRDGDRILSVAAPGEAVGELAFLLNERRTADVFAGRSGAEILNLDEETLHHLVENPSRMAAVILLNLSRSLARKVAETTSLLLPPDRRMFLGGGLY